MSVSRFPDQAHREFLELFETRDRSSVANVFYEAVRRGANTVTEVLGFVAEDVNERCRLYAQYDDAWPRRRTVIFANREKATPFARYAIDREKGDPARLARFRGVQGSPEDGTDSQIEDSFLAAWRADVEPHLPGIKLEAQYRLGIYRLDFAVPLLKVAVELDGHAYHKTQEQRTHDARKDRFLVTSGWRVLRFTGSEVALDAKGCCLEAARLIKRVGVFDLPVGPLVGKERA
jgi:very-short-patch-repair endonuclease